MNYELDLCAVSSTLSPCHIKKCTETRIGGHQLPPTTSYLCASMGGDVVMQCFTDIALCKQGK